VAGGTFPGETGSSASDMNALIDERMEKYLYALLPPRAALLRGGAALSQEAGVGERKEILSFRFETANSRREVLDRKPDLPPMNCSLFPIPYSLFPIPYSLFPVP
jgi:hypothetical protein